MGGGGGFKLPPAPPRKTTFKKPSLIRDKVGHYSLVPKKRPPAV